MVVASLKNIVGRAFPRLQDYVRIRRGFTGNIGGPPRIFFPRTFNDKIQRHKLFDRNPRYPDRVDKILVKEFVAKQLGDEWVTPTIWAGPSLPERTSRTWGKPYVVKANHGSVMNCFVRNEMECDWDKIEPLCEKWLGETYGNWGGEWVYSKVKRQIFVEPFIGELAGFPIDYKLWTFHGRVEFIQVDTRRETDHRRVMFDRRWKRLPFSTGPYPSEPLEIQRPSSLAEMIYGAETLSESVPFVRVDLYEINGRPRFGEMTYYPDSGWQPFRPTEFDRKIGDLWR